MRRVTRAAKFAFRGAPMCCGPLTHRESFFGIVTIRRAPHPCLALRPPFPHLNPAPEEALSARSTRSGLSAAAAATSPP